MSKSSFPTLISYLFIPSLWESVAGTATGSFLNYPIGQSGQTLTGTTTSTGLITTSDLIINNTKIHLGDGAGTTNQGEYGVAIGDSAGQTNQSVLAVAIGYGAGNINQGVQAIAIGQGAGELNQQQGAVSIGAYSNVYGTQGQNSVSLGYFACKNGQGDNSVAIGYNCAGTGNDSVVIGNGATTNTNTTSVAIGKSASTTANNQIRLGTASETVSIPGATTATGLITANGGLTMGSSNNITLGSGTAPTTNQLGYVYSLSAVSQTITNTTTTYLTITSLPIGVYIINANIVNMSGSSGVRVYIFAGSTQLIYGECASAVSGVSNGGGNVSYFLTNTSVQNITLRAITAISATITGCGMNLQAIKIA